jgi:tRNA U38,U39,U40 pseudouridine synthase TruA
MDDQFGLMQAEALKSLSGAFWPLAFEAFWSGRSWRSIDDADRTHTPAPKRGRRSRIGRACSDVSDPALQLEVRPIRQFVVRIEPNVMSASDTITGWRNVTWSMWQSNLDTSKVQVTRNLLQRFCGTHDFHDLRRLNKTLHSGAQRWLQDSAPS